MKMLPSFYDAMEGAAEVEFGEDGPITADDETIIQFLIEEGFAEPDVMEFMEIWKLQDEN